MLTHYDLQLDAYTTNTGYEEALRRDIVKEIKIKDGRYGLRYDIPGNTVEVSDGTYGGKRTPARMGKAQRLALVTGKQVQVDYEHDRYRVDEGYCGAAAVPYKGPKEISRTSTTTAAYDKETRVYLEVGGTGGQITFSLPEVAGRTVHAYVHKSPCAEHDRANTNEAVDEEVATAGGSFSFSFPVIAAGKTVNGSVTLTDEDGGTTTYTWELTRR